MSLPPRPLPARPTVRLAPAPLSAPLCALLLALLLPLSACGGPAATPVAKVLVLGIDGLEWSVLQPLMKQGRCPNLRALMERGTFGRLGTMVPTQSPIIWTTIATGKRPQDHQVFGFIDGKGQPYTSSRRNGRAVWNIADAYGLTSNVVGWWITWPVEEVRGVMVSGSSSAALIADNWKPALSLEAPDQVHPEGLEDEMLALAAEVGGEAAVDRLASERIFGAGTRELVRDVERKLIQQTLWSVQSDLTYAAIAAKVFAEHPADLNMVYLGGTDVAGHRFWRHFSPGEFSWTVPAGIDAALHCVIPNYYEWIDEQVGAIVAAVGEDATVLVVSDHGMTSNKDVRNRPPDPRRDPFITGHHHDGEPGVIIAAGPGIADDGDVEALLGGTAPPLMGTIGNVTPTVLALLGIPGGRDMIDRAYKPMLVGAALENAALRAVPSHDDGFREPEMVLMTADMAEDFKGRFRDLGYLELEGAEGGAQMVRPDETQGLGGAGDGAAAERPAVGSCAVRPPR